MKGKSKERVPFEVAVAAAQATMRVTIDRLSSEGIRPSPEAGAVIEAAVNDVLDRLGWTAEEMNKAVFEHMVRQLREGLHIPEGAEDELVPDGEPVPCDVMAELVEAGAKAEPLPVGQYL